MKGFLKTICGKTFLFILCVLSICLLAASIIAAVFMVEFDFYTQSKDAVYERMVYDKLRSDVYDDIWEAASSFDKDAVILQDDTLSLEILDNNNKIIGKTEDAGSTADWKYSLVYGVLKDKEGNIDDIFYSNVPGDRDVEYYTLKANIKGNKDRINFYSFIGSVIDKAYPLRYGIYAIGLIAAALIVVCFACLMSVAGRRRGDEELHPGPLNKVPFDIMLGIAAAALLLFVLMCDDNFMPGELVIALVVVGGIAFVCLFIGLCMSLAVRVKQKNLIKGSFMYFCLKYIVRFLKFVLTCIKGVARAIAYAVRNTPLIWKTLILFAAICIYELAFVVGNHFGEGPWVVGKIVLIPLVVYISLTLRALQKGGAALAEGDMAYRVKTDKMIWDFKKHGENLNSISKGMLIAVEDQMKSERMKTELITNVSHDIKTPLTSIINYSNLICEEPADNEKIHEYSEVLMRQSERLKRLIDDLVEASKASTGNLEVSLMPCDSATFVTQAAGEYEDKLKDAGLTLITSIPKKEMRIMADSRRMWRIFDNLMNNVSKYAQSGTRVYLSLEKIGGNAVFTFKNTSREQLNISEEELMERFTRGDQSRNTEGNGLGLSIAKSLAELQNGMLKVEIDGDLFKAILSFPLI